MANPKKKSLEERTRERLKQNRRADSEGGLYPFGSTAYEAQAAIRTASQRNLANYRTNFIKDRGQRMAQSRAEYRERIATPEYQREQEELDAARKRKEQLGPDFAERNKKTQMGKAIDMMEERRKKKQNAIADKLLKK